MASARLLTDQALRSIGEKWEVKACTKVRSDVISGPHLRASLTSFCGHRSGSPPAQAPLSKAFSTSLQVSIFNLLFYCISVSLATSTHAELPAWAGHAIVWFLWGFLVPWFKLHRFWAVYSLFSPTIFNGQFCRIYIYHVRVKCLMIHSH